MDGRTDTDLQGHTNVEETKQYNETQVFCCREVGLRKEGSSGLSELKGIDN